MEQNKQNLTDSPIRNLRGSPIRDAWKHAHKQTQARHYGCDVDFLLIEKRPPGIAGAIDVKRSDDRVSFTECIAYEQLTRDVAPVYICLADDPENGPFGIKLFRSSDYSQYPPNVDLQHLVTVPDWPGFHAWEARTRAKWREQRRKGGD